jgi:hypothetical protein
LSTWKNASAESTTFQTTTAAMSTGLPSLSLTLSFSLSKLRTRSETRRLVRNGLAQRSPVSRTVPT